jgi:hypothetical protein
MIHPDMAAAPYFSHDLAAHRGLQRLAYGVLEQVDAGLRDGMTERDAARQIERRLAKRRILELRQALSGSAIAAPEGGLGRGGPARRASGRSRSACR